MVGGQTSGQLPMLTAAAWLESVTTSWAPTAWPSAPGWRRRTSCGCSTTSSAGPSGWHTRGTSTLTGSRRWSSLRHQRCSASQTLTTTATARTSGSALRWWTPRPGIWPTVSAVWTASSHWRVVRESLSSCPLLTSLTETTDSGNLLTASTQWGTSTLLTSTWSLCQARNIPDSGLRDELKIFQGCPCRPTSVFRSACRCLPLPTWTAWTTCSVTCLITHSQRWYKYINGFNHNEIFLAGLPPHLGWRGSRYRRREPEEGQGVAGHTFHCCGCCDGDLDCYWWPDDDRKCALVSEV